VKAEDIRTNASLFAFQNGLKHIFEFSSSQQLTKSRLLPKLLFLGYQE